MQVKKQNINIGKAVFEGDIRTSAEGSIIVPDVKPDILKVLQVDAETYLCEKQADDGRIILKGKVNVNVLYVPESEDGNIGCIKGSLEFCETVKRAEFTPDVKIIASCDAEKVGYKLINSRKIGIEAQVVINTEVIADKSCSVICDIEDDAVQIRKDSIKLCSMNEYKEFSFTLEDVIELSGAQTEACEVLKSNVIILEKECRALSNKLVIKGKARISLMYLTTGGSCVPADFELPFTEVFDMEGLTEGSECDVAYQIGETDFAIAPATGGEGKCVAVSAQILVCVRNEAEIELPIVSDCYFTNSECTLSYEEIEAEEITDRPMFSAVLKELVSKAEGQPEIAGVYTVAVKPVICGTQIQNGRVAVSGKAVVYVIYMSENQQAPVCGMSEEIPFSYMIDCPNTSRGEEILLKVECEHISYTISSQNAVEIRCGLNISGKVIKKSTVRVINAVDIENLGARDSGMIIYFVKEGDSMWDIAKHYHVRCDDILARNCLEDEFSVSAGTKLIIPVTNC